jgi:hypothetical protein
MPLLKYISNGKMKLFTMEAVRPKVKPCNQMEKPPNNSGGSRNPTDLELNA